MNKETILTELDFLISEGAAVLNSKFMSGPFIYIEDNVYISWKTKIVAFIKLFLPSDNEYLVSFSKLDENDYSNADACIGLLKSIKYQIEKDYIATNNKKDIDMNIVLNNIFIIHGHNEAKWRELCSILKEDFMMNPLVLSEQPNQGLTIIEKFEKYAKTCSFAFAIFTPDDIVSNNGKEYFQARPNVIFELGWFYAKLGRNKVCILDQESDKSNIFSDLQGILRMQFKNNVREKYSEIQKELRTSNILE